MTRTIARTVEGGTEARSRTEELGSSAKRRIENAFIWRACTRIHAEEKRDDGGKEREERGRKRDRERERSDHHCPHGMRASRGEIEEITSGSGSI